MYDDARKKTEGSPLLGGRSALRLLAAAGISLALSACGGSKAAMVGAPRAAQASLPAAIATGCVYPSTQAQTVALPSAGGVTGSISVGAVAQASSTCDPITLATGSNATLSVATTSLRRRPADASPTPLPTPLAQVELTNVYTGQLNWFSITLQLPTGSVPAGQYPATITTNYDLGDGQVSTAVANFTVTVAANGTAVIAGPSLQGSLAVLTANTTGLLTIYPSGTVLPTPAPVPTESPTAEPTRAPTAAPTRAPTAVPTATPTTAPIPSPSPSDATFYADVTLTPSTCQQIGDASTTVTLQASATVPPPAGNIYLYGFSLAGLNGTTISMPGPLQGSLSENGTAILTTPNIVPGNGEGGGLIVNLFLSGGGGQVRSRTTVTGYAFAVTLLYYGASICPTPTPAPTPTPTPAPTAIPSLHR